MIGTAKSVKLGKRRCVQRHFEYAYLKGMQDTVINRGKLVNEEEDEIMRTSV
jgi:hypothetical protein